MQKVFYIIPRIFSVVNHNIESIAVAFILRLYSKFPFIAHFFSFQDPRYVSIVLQKNKCRWDKRGSIWPWISSSFFLSPASLDLVPKKEKGRDQNCGFCCHSDILHFISLRYLSTSASRWDFASESSNETVDVVFPEKIQLKPKTACNFHCLAVQDNWLYNLVTVLCISDERNTTL